MIAKYKSRSNRFVTAWLFLQLAGLLVGAEFGALISLAGGVCLIVGCCYYSKAKGHCSLWGLLGLLSIIGLIILVCFPDRRKQSC